MVLKFGHGVGPLTWILPFFIQPFAGVFYPISVLPEVFQKIAAVLPLSYVFEGFRKAYQGSFPWNLFFIALGLSFAYLLAGYLYFVYCIKKARKTGVLTRY